MNEYYPHLFSPLKINSVMLKNRVIASPMGIPVSHVLLSSTYYYQVSLSDRAKGGASLVFLSPETNADDNCEYPKYDRDGLREAISVARQYGAKVAKDVMPRLKISATLAMRAHYDGMVVHAPSPYLTMSGERAIELTRAEIKIMVEEASKEAIAAKVFGFDMICCRIGAEGIAAQFLSPLFNKRTDEYGDSLENRMRFSIEYIETVRKAVGQEFPIILHVGASHYLEGSYEFDEILTLINEVKDLVDLLHVSAGMDMIPGYFPEDNIIDPSLGFEAWYEVNQKGISIFDPHIANLHWAAKVKEKFPDKLVSVNASIMNPEEAEEMIAEGKVDAVVLGRALIADPFWPRKAMSGRREDIVPCIRCEYCYHTATIHRNTQCSVNPRYRRENRVPLELPKAKHQKKVVIIGAGPAGCTAALTAHKRGHEVILLEKTNEIGGQLNYAKYEKIKVDLLNYLNYLKVQIEKSGIDIRFNTTATPEMIEGLNPDALFVAIGACQIEFQVRGVNGERVYQALDIYPNLDSLGKKVTVIGGGMIGCELALELLERGREVTIIEQTDEIASRGHFLYRIGLRQEFEKYDGQLTVLKQSTCSEIQDSKVILEKDGARKEVDADSVVIAVGMKPNMEEAHGFYGIADETFMVGDCEKVGFVLDAVNDAYFIAANL